MSVRIFPLGCDFLLPLLEPAGVFTSVAAEANFILAINNSRASFRNELSAIRKLRKPLAWWTIEDPNWFDHYLPQARLADIVFTTDEACIPKYRQQLRHNRVFWLPLACSPEHHSATPTAADATDFVLSANWYENQARLWGVDTVVRPLIGSGRSLTLYSYTNFMWPAEFQPYWRGQTGYLTTSEQYSHGRVALGLNNQRSGLDGWSRTTMTSMRTFEVLACGKPFLTAHSDAYERLGLLHGVHLASVRSRAETLEWAERMSSEEGAAIAAAGQSLVLSRHTYRHRLQSIIDTVVNGAPSTAP